LPPKAAYGQGRGLWVSGDTYPQAYYDLDPRHQQIRTQEKEGGLVSPVTFSFE